MKTLYLASMQWPMGLESVCVSTSKARALREAVRILKAEHGTGPVNRPGACCEARITRNDIEVTKIPLV